jgi:hypothetical protein
MSIVPRRGSFQHSLILTFLLQFINKFLGSSNFKTFLLGPSAKSRVPNIANVATREQHFLQFF